MKILVVVLVAVPFALLGIGLFVAALYFGYEGVMAPRLLDSGASAIQATQVYTMGLYDLAISGIAAGLSYVLLRGAFNLTKD